MNEQRTVSVVIPYYDDQGALDLVLAALDAQTYPASCTQVVVADDGSPQAPHLGRRRYATRLVRQDDAGFRAAAARNLGASVASGDVVLFLDGDTVPEPGYLAAMVDRVGAGGVLVVGRRRHADLAGRPAPRIVDWLRRVAQHDPAREDDPEILPEPAWLAQGYVDTANLSRADDRSYRFVISAVLGLTATDLARVGGFDERFVGYGGEDWDLANRCRLAGLDLAHEPSAVAWHDGPDVAGRVADPAAARTAKNAETLRLAHVVTEPGARDPDLVWEHPDIVVELDDEGVPPASVVRCVADLVRGSDARVWLTDGAVVRDGIWPRTDTRAVVGPPPADALERCRFRVRVRRPVVLADRTLAELCEDGPKDHRAGVSVRRTRDLSRGVHTAPDVADDALAALLDEPSMEAWWGWQRSGDPTD